MSEPDPFNCPRCGSHDFGLHAMVNCGQCIHCNRRDAERYRWLKSLGGCVWDVACPDGWRSTYHRHDQMDAAIDAALADKPLSGPTP